MSNPLYINESGGQPEYTAASLRRSMSGLLTKGVADRLGARPGVFPSGEDAVSLSGVQVTVHDCNVVLNPALSSQDGPYIAHFTEHTHTLDPGDGSNDRIDIIVARVYDDDHDGSGAREAVTEYITGTPGVAPIAPPVPTGALLLREVNVPADGTGSPTLGRGAQNTVSSGGVLPVRDEGDLPQVGRYDGMVAWDEGSQGLKVFTGGKWRPIARPSGWEDIHSGVANSSTRYDIPSGVYDMVRVRVVGSLTGVGTLTLQVNNDSTSNLHESAWMTWNPSAEAILESSAFTGSTWTIGKWNSIAGSGLAELVILGTDTASYMPFSGHSISSSPGQSNRRFSRFSGRLASSRTLSSLTINSVGAGVYISEVRVWIEGHRS